MSRLLALYPRGWRDRYGEEFLALISERPPSLRDRVDIVRGALDARLNPQLPGLDRVPDRTGFATLAGFGLLMVAVLVGANGPVRYDEYGTYREGGAGLPFLILAAALLSIGLNRLIERLPPEAMVPRAAGRIAMVAGLLWSIMPWVMPIGVLFLVAVIILATGARRPGVWPTWLVVILVLLPAIPAALLAVLSVLPWYAAREAGLPLVTLLSPVGGLWLVVGLGLLRGFPRSVDP